VEKAELFWDTAKTVNSGNSYHTEVDAKYRDDLFRLKIFWFYNDIAQAVASFELYKLVQKPHPMRATPILTEEYVARAIDRLADKPTLEGRLWAEDQIMSPMDRLTRNLFPGS
jgi:hypothetical protein